MKLKFKLKNKITVAGVDTDVVELREPTTRDVRELGYPFTFNQDGTLDMNMKSIGKYIVRLSNLSDGDVDKLSIGEFNEISMELFTFLGNQMGNTQATASVN